MQAERPEALNFIIAGQVRSGAGIVQSSISSHPQATCHGDLLHEDLTVRRACHEDYFGPSKHEEIPECYWSGRDMSPEQYLSGKVFDHNERGERAVGLKLLYPQLHKHQLWEYLTHWCLAGDFCLIHVRRNPLVCYVSLKQAQASGNFYRDFNDSEPGYCPMPISIDVPELVEFCNWHAAFDKRAEKLCDDRLVFTYRELCMEYRRVMRTIFEFLQLEPFVFAVPGTRRLRNLPMDERVRNWGTAYGQCPPAIQEFFHDDLY